MNSYKLTKSKITFSFRYDKEIVSAIKLLFNGTRYTPETKEWTCDNTLFNIQRCDHLVKMYNFEEENDEEKFTYGELSGFDIVTPEQLEETKQLIQDYGFKRDPWDYQTYGISFMTNIKSCLNGDDMGLGKTGQAVVSTEIKQLFPALIITPSSVKYNWEKEWEKWVDGRTISVIDGKEVNFDAEVVVINYDIITKHKVQLMKRDWKVVVMDESQYVKNSKSQRSKTARALSKKVDYRFLLTGTMIMNRPDELIHQLTIMKVFNEKFGGWKKFIFKYCDAHYGGFGLDSSGASNTLELNKLLRETCYLRREKSVVKKDMPNRIDTIIEVPFTRKRDYNKACLDIIGYLRDTEGEDVAERAEGAPSLVMSNKLKEISIDGKLKGIIKWIEDFKESTSDKLLVFGRRTLPLEELSKHFKSDLINGSTNAKDKLKLIEKFQDSKDQILFGNIKSLGTGVDGLQYVCSHILFIELPDVPTELEQAIARLHRSGQDKTVNNYYATNLDCVDELMWDVLLEKYEVVDAVNKGIKGQNRQSKSLNMDQEIAKRAKKQKKKK